MVGVECFIFAQREDEELKSFKTTKTALRLQWMQIPGSGDQICCDTSTDNPRPYVPAILRRRISFLFTSYRIPEPKLRKSRSQQGSSDQVSSETCFAGKRMHTMSACQSSSTYCDPIGKVRASRPRTPRHCRTSAYLPRSRLFTDVHRQIHALAGGNTCSGHHC